MADGDAVVAWQDYMDGSGYIFAQRLQSDGQRQWVKDVRVNAPLISKPILCLAPVGVDASGNAVIAWQTYARWNYDIYAQKLDVAGQILWPADVRVNSDTSSANQSDPTLAMYIDGGTIVSWTDNRSGNPELYSQRLAPNGNKVWPQDVQVKTGGGQVHWSGSSTAIGSNDDAVVVWADDRTGNSAIYAKKLDANGQLLWNEHVLVATDTTGYQYYPSVSADGSGNAIVTWMDGRNGSYDIFAQELNSGGSRLWSQVLPDHCSLALPDDDYPAIARLVLAGCCLVLNTRNGNEDIYGQALDGNGWQLWTVDPADQFGWRDGEPRTAFTGDPPNW